MHASMIWNLAESLELTAYKVYYPQIGNILLKVMFLCRYGKLHINVRNDCIPRVNF